MFIHRLTKWLMCDKMIIEGQNKAFQKQKSKKMQKIKQKIRKSFFSNLSTVMTFSWHTVFLLSILNTHHMKMGHHDAHSKHPVFVGGIDEITHFLHMIAELV